MRNINKVSTLTNEFLQRISIIDDNIKSLWCEGKIDQKWSKMPTVAIVGSRKPTDYGRSVTLKLASALAARGVIIISGLALGHDALAARGALDVQIKLWQIKLLHRVVQFYLNMSQIIQFIRIISWHAID